MSSPVGRAGWVGTEPCPCGLAATYGACCGRLHARVAEAVTPEELMRSRYAAYVVGGETGTDHLFRTWHPRTRPDDLSTDPSLRWTGLRVLAAVGDEVEFTAGFEHAGGSGLMHERSRFELRRGRWVYVDGEVIR